MILRLHMIGIVIVHPKEIDERKVLSRGLMALKMLKEVGDLR